MHRELVLITYMTETTMNIICIVPRLPPVIDGVGDYTLTLARKLRSSFGVNTIFLAIDLSFNLPSSIDGFTVEMIESHSSAGLICSISKFSQNISAVIVQYANYGYDRWGCPFWLIKGLRQWKERAENIKLLTMFHELHNNNSSPPWKHNFWAVPQQKKLAFQLAEISDFVVTNCERYKIAIQEVVRRKDIKLLPVFSNIAEIENFKELKYRERNLVVFGQQRRSSVYKYSLDILTEICQLLSIKSIIDIGPMDRVELPKMTGIQVISLGECSAEKVSETLLNSWVGFLNYSSDPLTKSGVFASYCAHGLIPIVHKVEVSLSEKLVSGDNYWNIDLQPVDKILLSQSEMIASRAHQWYQPHNLSQHSNIFYSLITT
jgi:hypothetical protein